MLNHVNNRGCARRVSNSGVNEGVFPENLNRGMDRASAVIILNSAQTGRPEAFIEGSIISAKRTAASAALAARTLHEGLDSSTLGLFGCGLINYAITRFVFAACPDVERVIVYDTDEQRRPLVTREF